MEHVLGLKALEVVQLAVAVRGGHGQLQVGIAQACVVVAVEVADRDVQGEVVLIVLLVVGGAEVEDSDDDSEQDRQDERELDQCLPALGFQCLHVIPRLAAPLVVQP